MAEILRVISRSPTDALPVFKAIVDSAASLCQSLFANLFLFDGEFLHYVATHSAGPDIEGLLRAKYPMRPDTTQVSGRVLLSRSVVRLKDARADRAYDHRIGHSMAWTWRMLGVPMMRGGLPLGAIVVGWKGSGRITRDQENLLKAFADQAVIALGNVQLFEELRRKSRELDLANTYKSRLLTAASHDLRQPLQALNLYVGQLQDERDVLERARLVERLDAALGTINELFNTLLDMSRLEAGALEPQISAFPVAALLDRVVTTFAEAAQAKGLRLRTVRSDAWVRSDFVLLERILFNLVSNAVRYTARGGIVIGCRRRGTVLHIEVWDSGTGIAGHQREEIFREFYRGDTAAQDGQGGLGLGLAIVERLGRLLGHEIEVRSRQGRGSCFAVRAQTVAANEEAKKVPPGQALPADPVQGKVIVVIDDDPLVRDSMRGLLRKWNCVVATAVSGRDALTQLATLGRAADLIISDDRLEDGQTGRQAIELIRTELGVPIPAFLISGDTDSERMRQAKAGGYLLLHKPVPPLALRNAVNRVLRQSRADA